MVFASCSRTKDNFWFTDAEGFTAQDEERYREAVKEDIQQIEGRYKLCQEINEIYLLGSEEVWTFGV